MARTLRNISGETRTLQDASGRWHVIEDQGVLVVDDADGRYYQTGEQGEPAIWEDAAPTKKPTKTSTIEEAE